MSQIYVNVHKFRVLHLSLGFAVFVGVPGHAIPELLGPYSSLLHFSCRSHVLGKFS